MFLNLLNRSLPDRQKNTLHMQSGVRADYHDFRRQTECGWISSLNEYLAHIGVGRAVGFERGLKVVARAAVVPERLPDTSESLTDRLTD